MFDYLRDAIEDHPGARVFSDIGCYTLGALPPYEAINSCVDMGASITMAKGAAEAGVHPAVAVIGDSTFTHSGITGLLDVVEDRSPVTVIISDNMTTGMTGGQHEPRGGPAGADRAPGSASSPRTFTSSSRFRRTTTSNVELLKRELDYMGPSVIISRRPCIQTGKRPG